MRNALIILGWTLTLVGLSLAGCTAYDADPQARPEIIHNALMDQIRLESQQKIAGYPQLQPGMPELLVRQIMGPRPISPAPNTLEYTAYVHGDTDTIYIFTLVLDQGVLKSKSMRQIPPLPVTPRPDLFE